MYLKNNVNFYTKVIIVGSILLQKYSVGFLNYKIHLK